MKGEPRTWLRGETNSQGYEAEKTVEGVRNVEDGTKQEWVPCVNVDASS